MKNERDNNLSLMLKSISVGLICSAAICLAALFFTGYMLLSFDMSDSVLNGVIGAVCSCAVFAGSFITSRMAGRAGLIMGAVNTILCFAVMCIICLASYDKVPGAAGFVRFGIMLLFGMSGGALGVRKIKTPSKAKKRR